MKLDKHSVGFALFCLVVLQLMMIAALIFSSEVSASPQAPTPTLSPDFTQILPALVARADRVVRAQVLQSTTQWNSDHTLLETEHTLAVRYTLVGEPARELIVRTNGGFLAAEGIGMRSSHTPTFTPGEEVLVFLQQAGRAYQVIEGEAGKLAVFQTEAVSGYYQAHLTLEQAATTIQAAAQRQGQRATLPTNWRAYEGSATARQVNAVQEPLVDPRWPGAKPKIKVRVNLNSSHIGDEGGSAEQFLVAIQNALRTWSVVEEAEFTFIYDGTTTSTNTGYNNANEIVFMSQGKNNTLGKAMVWYTSNGTILEADMWVNEDYQVDATLNPSSSEVDLESIVLHEMGHWLPLPHVDEPEAIMYAVLGTGARKPTLHTVDRNGISTLYPCALTPCVDPAYASTATPTATVTPSAIATTDELTSETPTPTATVTISQTEVTGTPTATPTLPTITLTPGVANSLFLPLVTR